jgi:hypothetical protein
VLRDLNGALLADEPETAPNFSIDAAVPEGLQDVSSTS